MSSICFICFKTLLLLFPNPRTSDSHYLYNHNITIFLISFNITKHTTINDMKTSQTFSLFNDIM